MDYRKSIFDERPSLVEYEGKVVRINFDVEQKEVPAGTDTEQEGKGTTRIVYEAYVVRVAHPVERDTIVDAIVTAAYPQDKMQAIINNHLLDGGDDAEHEREFKEMQEWRKHAKEVADSVTADM